MHLEFLLEEQSAEAALKHLVPRIVGDQHTAAFHAYQGKDDLLGKLEARLKGYKFCLTPDTRIIVLVDEDRDPKGCRHLKQALEDAARTAGLATKSVPDSAGRFQVLNRVAVEELEAWFFGDIEAMAAAFPRVPMSLGRRSRFRDPDAIVGGTWEALQRVLQRAGYYRAGLPKIGVADRIAQHMDPGRNRSRSFRVFREGLCLAVA